MIRARASRGFTLVELLIVIVVIAILAAITIVAYGNVTSKATTAMLQSDLSQAKEFLETYRTQNGAYPVDIATAIAAGLKVSAQDDLSYTVDDTSNPQAYTLIATNGSQKYYLNSTNQSTPQSGAWVVNYAINPHAASGGPSWTNQTPAGSTLSWDATGAQDGGSAYKIVTTAAGQIRIGVPSSVGYVSPGDVLTIAVDVKAPVATTVRFEVGVAGSYYPKSDSINLVVGWNRVIGSTTIPSGVSGNVTLTQLTGDATNLASGLTWEASRAVITRGDVGYSYADGNSSGWSWDGMSNASPSEGIIP